MYNLNSVYFTDINTGYAVGNEGMNPPFGGIILKTINGGTNWTSMPFLNVAGLFSVYFTNQDTGYAVGGNGSILKTTDAGNIWTLQQISDTTIRFHSVFFSDSNIGYAVGGYESSLSVYGILCKTTNGGIDWTSEYLPFGWAIPSSVYFLDAETGYLVGNEGWGWGTIEITTNGGINWSSQYSVYAVMLYSVYFPSESTGYAVGYDYGVSGLILKTTNGGVGLNESAFVSKILKIYPNPAKDKITIESLMTGDARLSILNVNSQEVVIKQITDHKTQIDISDLPSGVYIVRLKNENTFEMRKLIIE
jgi:photosystem II stability/assembly factor-like uncharacterized protein